MCHVYKSSQKWDQNQNKTYLRGSKTTIFFLQGLKQKRDIFAWTKTIFLPIKITLISYLIPFKDFVHYTFFM